ncbi:hypothetical protein HanXRQr2_Chr13g0566761 [Helianthus annuus]|uniref:Uncharacterized protein n=1 Tax=Helianthus annuus TaxID=4232 RepID=A0A9K3HAS9_HELAN|nr:hypothetical protein HanXRQr2_Chr13g0566761 [Helianthus annuus]KAJ0847493.1 hypothetical protein HanPSC8_Chr13g0545931 [Helianthus annuus]
MITSRVAKNRNIIPKHRFTRLDRRGKRPPQTQRVRNSKSIILIKHNTFKPLSLQCSPINIPYIRHPYMRYHPISMSSNHRNRKKNPFDVNPLPYRCF